ncbi:MAG: hypothetical protein ACKOPM_01230 [Novosphingobium sp.]
MPILSLILAQAAAFAAEPLADPLAGITPDWQLCEQPDEAARTCSMKSTFVRTAGGQFETVDVMSITGLPGLVIEIKSVAYVKDGALCGIARLKDLDGARIVRHVDGATAKQEAAAIQSLRFLYPIEGKEICSAFHPDGVNFRLKSTANGKPLPIDDTVVRWVHKDDGFSVAGWQGAITTPMGTQR